MNEQNDIQYNIKHDDDKDARLTIYLTEFEKSVIEAAAQGRGESLSDFAGDILIWACSQRGFLPNWYERPKGGK